MKDLIKRCLWYECALEQRLSEIDAGLGTKGTQAYEDRGCYDCFGLDDKKKCYYYRKEVKNKTGVKTE